MDRDDIPEPTDEELDALDAELDQGDEYDFLRPEDWDYDLEDYDDPEETD